MAPLRPTEARRLLDRCLGSGGQVIVSKHAADRMVARAITRDDLFAALRSGWVGNAEAEGGSWRYPVQGRGVCAIVAFVATADAVAVVVTAWRLQ